MSETLRAPAGTVTAGGPVTLARRRIYILPTSQGVGFAAMLAVMLLGSANYNNGLGYVLTFLLGSLALVSILHTYRNLVDLRASPGGARPVFAGDPATFDLLLDNRGGTARHAVMVRYRSTPGVKGPGDRAVETDVAAHDARRVGLVAAAPERGWRHLGRVTVASRYPLGLFRAWSPLEPGLRCLVYPRPGPARPLPEPTSGAHAREQSSDEGAGQEDFAGLREYRPGDLPRQIHWKAVARGQGLPVKLFSGDGVGELMLDLDAAGPGDLETRLSQLCRWVLDAEREGLRYGLEVPGRSIAPGAGDRHREACLGALALHALPAAEGGS